MGIDAGKKVKSKKEWESGDVGIDSYGFCAIPSYWRESNGFFNKGFCMTYFWSSTEISSRYAYRLGVDEFEDANLGLETYYKDFAYSVRPIRD
ncbi:MAG: hypothetical protein J6Q11_01455 [Fibrobacteraceae bacterium]|nr:hypothetical protein [Fibrobacteraceae bacterium]